MQRFLFTKNSGWFFAACAASIFSVCTQLGIAFLLQLFIDAATAGAFPLLLRYGAAGAGLCLLLAGAAFLEKSTAARYARRGLTLLKSESFAALAAHPEELRGGSTAQYLSLLNNDAAILETNLFAAVPQLVQYAASCLLAIAALWWYSPLLTGAALAANLLPLLAPLLFAPLLARRQKDLSQARARYNVCVKDALAGAELIFAYGAAGRMARQHDRVNETAERASCRVKTAAAGNEAAGSFVGFGVFIFIMFLASYLVAQGRLTLGGMMACVQLLNSVVNPLLGLTQLVGQVRGTKPLRDAYRRLLALPDASPTACPAAPSGPLVLEHVSFSYGDVPTLSDVSAAFLPGKKYAVVGPSGCGKTTLLKLLAGQETPAGGAASLGGEPLQGLSPAARSQSLCLIQQQVFLFDDTLRNNVTLYADHPDAAVWEALSRAGLREKAAALPQQLDTPLTEGGGVLSGGERQRISIARALLRKTPFLLMDEATGALDPQTALAVENAVLRDPSLTAVLVTHRLEETFLCRCDEILVLQKGRIAERGSYRALMEARGVFYAMQRLADS